MKQRYFISRHQSTELSEVIEFVIDQNNKHHKKNQEKEVPIEEVNLLVKEEASNSFGEDIMTFSEGNVNIENGINTVHVLANHRKFNASYLITEMRFSARKRFLGGWISYKTEFFIQAPNGPEQSLGEHKSPFICQLPLNDGTKIYLWSRGVGSENKALMTISK